MWLPIPQKAALLLSLVLTRTSEPDEVQRYFDEVLRAAIRHALSSERFT